MLNPYRSTTHVAIRSRRPRGVRRYVLLSVLTLTCGVLASVPAAVLLNQEWQVIPTNVYTSSIECNGVPIANRTVIGYSVTIAFALFAAGVVSGFVAARNKWSRPA